MPNTDKYYCEKIIHDQKTPEQVKENLKYKLLNSECRCDCCGTPYKDSTIKGICPGCGNPIW